MKKKLNQTQMYLIKDVCHQFWINKYLRTFNVKMNVTEKLVESLDTHFYEAKRFSIKLSGIYNHMFI